MSIRSVQMRTRMVQLLYDFFFMMSNMVSNIVRVMLHDKSISVIPCYMENVQRLVDLLSTTTVNAYFGVLPSIAGACSRSSVHPTSFRNNVRRLRCMCRRWVGWKFDGQLKVRWRCVLLEVRIKYQEDRSRRANWQATDNWQPLLGASMGMHLSRIMQLANVTHGAAQNIFRTLVQPPFESL